MRSSRLPILAVLVALAACGPRVPSAGAVPPAKGQPLPSSSLSSASTPVLNGTTLVAEALPSPTSAVHLYFATPELAEQIPIEAPGSYQVRLLCDVAGEEPALIDVALDGGRPRRLAGPLATIALGQLVAADAELVPGLHWLFAAPVLGSGLVPRRAAGAPRSAVARRFFVGKREASGSPSTGAVWLRKPEGTYNGAAAAHDVLFDVYVFSAAGAPLDVQYTLTLHGPNLNGDLRFPSPFTVHDVPSGDYEVLTSAPTAKSLSTRFTVNRELGGTP
ncbi:MAG: hypothetical protein ABIQ16_01070 [Polyangiaceae bacterium]